jgi:hypothetical protein
LLRSVDRPFAAGNVPSSEKYAPPTEANEALEFFPNLKLLRGTASYEADNKANKDEDTTCRKDTHNHSTLTPGLFTAFCPHGICLGFQMMEACESPRTALDIMVRRFDEMPKLVIYDNACKLHAFALKREPVRFKNTRFMIDRMHARGHIGCSLAYDMRSYDCDYLNGLNSQVCEQGNSGLRHLATQLTYMPPANVMKHVSVYLAISNYRKHYPRKGKK